jgi:hypothetical protein
MTPLFAWYPPQFPEQGRLPTSAALVRKNCRMQDSQERAYRDELCLAAGKRVEPPCCKTLHISIFFDGTGNNLNNDLYLSTPPHPTNIARLFRATIGQGTAGGVQGRQEALFDLAGEAGNQYFKYYIPGVGTPFPEVSDLDYSMPGLAAATYGEERINWALIRLIDALRLTLGMPGLTDDKSWGAVRRMTAPMGAAAAYAASLRSAGFQRLLTELEPNLKKAVAQPEPGKPKLLGIKLYVYGFSRGAASARAFVNWLAELLPKGLASEAGSWTLALSVEFLGLLDTVASVGVAHIAPLAEGHMAWADGAMELPDTGLIKNCVHLVSAHEQRLCFPLDSICYHDGSYPSWAKEVVYPGMHSDIGGGYPPGDQGKAVADSDGYLLSQVVLHDIYASAFQAGAPLKIPEDAIPLFMKSDDWRIMSDDLISEFMVTDILVNRFNAWRDLTLLGYSWRADISDEDAAQYKPELSSANIIEILQEQMAWITAWRIGRYAHGTYREQNFYQNSAANGQNKDSDPAVRKASEKARDKKQKDIEDIRRELLISAKKGAYILYPPGIKDFDPALGQTQLRDAAEEFHEDYQRKRRTQTGNFLFQSSEALSNLVYTFSDDDLTAEYKRMKKAGNARFEKLFPARRDNSHEQQLWVLVRELFDNQVHDSRAWFMQATFNAREPWGSYFLYRMIYFGEVMSKNVTPLIKYGRFIKGRLLDSLPGAAVYIERFEKIIGVEGEEFPPEIEQKILIESHATDIPVAQYSDFIAQPALTREPVEAIALQKTRLEERELADKKAIIASLWS